MGGKHYEKQIHLFQADEIYWMLKQCYIFTKGYTGIMEIESLSINKKGIPIVQYTLSQGRYIDLKKSVNSQNIVRSNKKIVETLSLFVDKLLISEYVVGESLIDHNGKPSLTSELITDIYNVYNFGVYKLIKGDEDSFDECTMMLKKMYRFSDGFNVVPYMTEDKIHVSLINDPKITIDIMLVGDVLFSEIDGTIRLCKKNNDFKHIHDLLDYSERMIKSYKSMRTEMTRIIKEELN